MSELIIFAKKAQGMATIWAGGDKAVENLAAEIRKVPGFGGKGFRMKEPWGLNKHPVRTHSCGRHVLPPWDKMPSHGGRPIPWEPPCSCPAVCAEPAEVVLDLAEIAKTQQIEDDLVDFGVVGLES